MTTDTSTKKALIRYAIVMTALAGIILWSAYLVRAVLLLLYVSGLLAIGFSPIVRLIERRSRVGIPVCRIRLGVVGCFVLGGRVDRLCIHRRACEDAGK